MFISVRGATSGPLFCWPGGAPTKRSIFVEQLNRALRFCNLDPTLYKAHSFRISAATWAAAKGLSDAQIRQLGRLKSNAFLSYIICTPSLSTHAARSCVICPQAGAEEPFTLRLFLDHRLRVGRASLQEARGLFSPPSPLPERKNQIIIAN